MIIMSVYHVYVLRWVVGCQTHINNIHNYSLLGSSSAGVIFSLMQKRDYSKKMFCHWSCWFINVEAWFCVKIAYLKTWGQVGVGGPTWGLVFRGSPKSLPKSYLSWNLANCNLAVCYVSRSVCHSLFLVLRKFSSWMEKRYINREN